jgi:hypothetical protein
MIDPSSCDRAGRARSGPMRSARDEARACALLQVMLCCPVLLLTGCDDASPPSYRSQLIGTWRDDASSFEKTYFADGSSCSRLSHEGSLQHGEVHWIRGKWRIDGDRLVSSVVASSDPDLAPGATFVDRIVAFHPDRFEFEAVGGLGIEVRHRVPSTRGKNECKPVRSYATRT